ncbi:MAG: PD-(D/E)XK nuclease family transposase [Coprobacillus sp.]
MYNKVSDFCSDYFFHYLMHHCDHLRLELCRYLSNDDSIKYTTIENSDTYSTHKGGRKRVLDIVVKDDKDRYYNYEMQNNDIAYSDIKRFQIYAMRLIERQMIGHNTLNHLNKVRQLIIYTGKAIDNLKYYHHKMELYDKRYEVLLEKGLIIMNIMQLEKMEEEEMEVIRRDIHQVMRLFKDEEAHKEEQESELAKEVVKIYEEFVGSKEYYDYIAIERDRWYVNDRMEEKYEAGINQGKEEGKLSAMKIAMKEIYHRDDIDWLNQLTFKQLEEGFQLVFKGLEYEELKKRISLLNF